MIDDNKNGSDGHTARVGANHTEDFMLTWGKVDLTKDQRAERLAKIALGWDNMTTVQQMENAFELVRRSQQIKETL